MKQVNGITLVALVITIILLLLLAGVTMSVVGEGGILGNAEKAVDMSKVSSMQNKIKMAIAKKMVVSDRSVDLEDIVEQLEKQGIVKSGDSNVEIGQVKTQPDGYVYEIKEKANGNWEVTYIGNGDIGVPEVIITLSKNTTGLTDEVVITMTAKADSGIASYILPEGTSQSVTSGTKEVTKTYTAAQNGTYEFTVVNRNGNSVSKSVIIDNILEDTIEISANKTMPTIDDVIVTIKWPSDANKGVKQVQVGEGAWQTVTGAISQITVSQNCKVTARVRNSIGEISSASLNISNIDKTKPTIITTEGIDIIDWETDKEISSYFTIEANGTMDITSIEYIDTSNGNAEVENINTLTVGTHIIECIVTKETGAVSSTTKTIEVESLVFANLYKINNTEYHLIFNGTGSLAQGYSESQLVERGTNIKDGSNRIEVSDEVYISSQPWGTYAENITKVKIEEKIKPRNTSFYFYALTSITEIEGLSNLDTTNVVSMSHMFFDCSNLISLDVRGFDTGKVTDMRGMFAGCSSLTSLDVRGFNTTNVIDMVWMFYGCSSLISLDLSVFDTTKVTTMEAMFCRCSNLNTLNVSNFNTGNVTHMGWMFEKCSNLTKLNLSSFNTENVTHMNWMFYECFNLTNLNISEFDTKKVTTMEAMFYNCNKLNNLDVSKFNTKNVTTMASMFDRCESLPNLDVSGFEIDNVTDMRWMFYKCHSLTSLAVNMWNTSNVTNMQSLFDGCTGLTSIDLSNWNTSKVTNMIAMFWGCTNLSKIYVGNQWSTSAVTSGGSMFGDCTSLSGAISYNSSKTNQNYANYTTGYFTYKAST